MWNALGLCFQACGEPSTALAVRCHVRALPHDREGVALHELVRGVCVFVTGRQTMMTSRETRSTYNLDPARSSLLHTQAKLHSRLGQREEAARYHALVLEKADAEGVAGQDAVEALTYLADWYRVRCCWMADYE